MHDRRQNTAVFCLSNKKRLFFSVIPSKKVIAIGAYMCYIYYTILYFVISDPGM